MLSFGVKEQIRSDTCKFFKHFFGGSLQTLLRNFAVPYFTVGRGIRSFFV
jgi:hypothetical protein